MIRSTKQHTKYWSERKINWHEHYSATWNHPHREIIIQLLKTFNWFSLWEVGCASGPNLIRIIKEFPGRQLGGSDLSADAIELARTTFNGGKFHVESAEDLLLSDKAVDVLLADATLIYIGPRKIKKVLNEFTRITRNRIILCEFHSTSFWRRWLLRLRTGYNAYNYQQLLEEAGAYDIQMVKIPKEYWPGTPWEEWGWIISAKLPIK